MNSTALPLLSSLLVAAAAFFAAASVPDIWDAITRKYIADLAPTIRALGIDESRIPTYLRWWGATMIGVFALLTFVLRMLPVALPAIYLIYIAPRLWLKWMIKRRQVLLRDQLVGATVALANTARAGMSLAQGIESVAKETPQPLARELARIVHDHKRGLPLPKVINDTKLRLQLDSFTLFSAAVLACLERGGRVTDALDRISRSLQENQRVERKIESETASGRKVVRILAVFPLFFLLLFLVIYPQGTMTLFISTIGQVVLAIVIILVFISVRWSNRILAVDA